MTRDHDCAPVAKTECEDPSRHHDDGPAARNAASNGEPAARNAASNGEPRAVCLQV
jgi:hypothetical protein